MSPTSQDAAEALKAMHASQSRLAAAADCPPQRHLAFGVLMGCLVATPALPTVYALLVEAAVLIGIALVVRWDRRRTGMFINGYRAGRTRPLTFAMLAVILSLYTASYWLAHARGVTWAPIALGLLAAAGGFYGSMLWQRAFRRELGVAA